MEEITHTSPQGHRHYQWQAEIDLDQILADESAEQATWPWWKKVYKGFC